MKIAATYLMRGRKTYVNYRGAQCPHYPGLIQNAGGKVENEDYVVAAQREVHEEAGLKIPLNRFIPLKESDEKFPDGAPYKVYAFTVELLPHEQPSNPESEKQSDWKLVSIKWLCARRTKLVPALDHTLESLLKNRAQKEKRSARPSALII